jgi:hypothetical protein
MQLAQVSSEAEEDASLDANENLKLQQQMFMEM